MAIDILAPLDGAVTEGVLVCWHCAVGERVSRHKALAEIETDKITLEVLAPEDGTLIERCVELGRQITRTTVVARLEPH